MYLYVGMCMHAYAYVCICMYVYIYVHMYVYVCICMYMYICTYVCNMYMYACVSRDSQLCVHLNMHLPYRYTSFFFTRNITKTYCSTDTLLLFVSSHRAHAQTLLCKEFYKDILQYGHSFVICFFLLRTYTSFFFFTSCLLYGML